MSSKEQADKLNKATARQRPSQPGVWDFESLIRQTHPATILRRARLAPSSLIPGDVLQMQRMYGNRAVSQMLAASPGHGIIQRRGENGEIEETEGEVEETEGEVEETGEEVEEIDYGGKPAEPTISVYADRSTQEAKWGKHAAVFLAKGKKGKVSHHKIHLKGTELDTSKLSTLAKIQQKILGLKDKDEAGVEIEIKTVQYWGSEEEGTPEKTYKIDPGQDEAALKKAQEMQAQQSKYWYSHTGRGSWALNCASFAEKVLKAAGVKTTAGTFFKTPSHLVLGKSGGFKSTDMRGLYRGGGEGYY